MSDNLQFIDRLVDSVVLDPLKAGQPLPTFTTPREDAEWWAEWAMPAELAAYGYEASIRAPRDAQKRIFWTLWQSFSEAEHAAFLSKIRRAA